MVVLSLFDGMSCGQIALNRAGIYYSHYFASEIDKYAISVTQHNYPQTIQLGDVSLVNIRFDGIYSGDKKISDKIPDLLIGGSPCQGFSFAGLQLNFDDPRSILFFEYVRIFKDIRKYKPNALFLLENVKMKKEYQDVISERMGVEPVKINSALVSAQNRERLYWSNIPVSPLVDKGILLESIIEKGEVDRDKSLCLDAKYFKGVSVDRYLYKSKRQIIWTIPEATKKGYVKVTNGDFIDLTFIKSKTRRGRLMLTKSNCLTATAHTMCMVTNDWFRKLSPLECERLQTVPNNYTAIVSNSQRYKMLGNGWTVDVIAEAFFKHLDLY